MKPMEETEDKWGEEEKMLELRMGELEETLKAERTRDLDRKHLRTSLHLIYFCKMYRGSLVK